MAGKLRIAAERFIADFFSAHRVTHFFYVPVCLYQVIKEMTSLGIQPIAAHSEKAAAHLADGYEPASSRLGLSGAQSIGGATGGCLPAPLRCLLKASSFPIRTEDDAATVDFGWGRRKDFAR
jgi:hypothetical protein